MCTKPYVEKNLKSMEKLQMKTSTICDHFNILSSDIAEIVFIFGNFTLPTYIHTLCLNITHTPHYEFGKVKLALQINWSFDVTGGANESAHFCYERPKN
jgi:hypothetical protein